MSRAPRTATVPAPMPKPFTPEAGKFCYYVGPETYVMDEGFRAAIVFENIPGYTLTGNWPYEGKPGQVAPYFWGHKLAEAQAQADRVPPARSPRYLTYVQAEPCCGCDAPAPSEAHHEGPRGVSQKASDFLTAPLCWRCHHAVTATHALPGRSQGETRALIHQIQAALLARWAAAREAEAEREAEQVAQVPILRLVAGGGR